LTCHASLKNSDSGQSKKKKKEGGGNCVSDLQPALFSLCLHLTIWWCSSWFGSPWSGSEWSSFVCSGTAQTALAHNTWI